MTPGISDNLLALLLAVVACVGNVLVAYIGVMRDRLTRVQLAQKVEEARGQTPTNEHVIELVNQTDSLHAVCKKLLLAKGRREQAERLKLQTPDVATPDELQVIDSRQKRVGVIRRISN